MISLGNWSIRRTPDLHHFDKHNYTEKFTISYKGNICGFAFLCDFDNKWWVYINNSKIHNKFIKDNRKFYKENIKRTRNGNFALQKQNYVLMEELVRLWDLEKETKLIDDNFYVRVVIENLFDKIYYEKVSDRQIIQDIKKQYPTIKDSLSNSQIKKCIIKIFQVQDLVLNLDGKCCKTRKSGLLWDLCNF